MNNDDQKIRAVLYIRVATKSRLDDMPMDAQSARLRKQAERDGIIIAGEIRAYEKGGTLNRPGWNEALCLAVKQRANAIMVDGIDRVARSIPLALEALADMDRHGLKLRTCDWILPFTKGAEQDIL